MKLRVRLERAGFFFGSQRGRNLEKGSLTVGKKKGVGYEEIA